jgi:hypothetical protein
MPDYGIAEFISDPDLLEPWFVGESWDNWRLVLRAAFSETLTVDEAARFCELADRDPPGAPCRELWCAIGRRAGKAASHRRSPTHAAVCGDLQRHLRQDERALALCGKPRAGGDRVQLFPRLLRGGAFAGAAGQPVSQTIRSAVKEPRPPIWSLVVVLATNITGKVGAVAVTEHRDICRDQCNPVCKRPVGCQTYDPW